ncbi:MAG: zinc-binding alcohol dehydrogenase family protein [Pseudomonadota bacterium]
MKAIGYNAPGPIDGAGALHEFETDKPSPEGQDLLVRVEAVSVNPVDTKIRVRRAPEGVPAILGWDAAGVVDAVGPDAQGFAVGDRVWYAGAIDRPGTNAEYHLVDARIVGHAPKSLGAADAAALPLTTLTAYEMLFDRLDVTRPVPGAANAVVVIGGAGGVGSITIQLLRALTDLTVIATASRSETQDWARKLGAHHVIDHRAPLPAQIEALGIGQPGFVFSTTHTDSYVDQIAELIAPQGRFGLIDDPDALNIGVFKPKSVSTHWEFMYTRSLFGTADMERQGVILNETAAMIDAGRIQSTATETLGTISAHNLTRAHEILESQTARGKLVLAGWDAD